MLEVTLNESKLFTDGGANLSPTEFLGFGGFEVNLSCFLPVGSRLSNFCPQRSMKHVDDLLGLFPGSAGGCPPTPPQTRTSTINASGSS